MIHVDHSKMRAPFGQGRRHLSEAANGSHHEHFVVERQRDEIHDEWPIVEHERAPGVVWSSVSHVTSLIHDRFFRQEGLGEAFRLKRALADHATAAWPRLHMVGGDGCAAVH